MKRVGLMIFMLLPFQGWAMDTLRVDLKPAWLQHTETGFIPWQDEVRVVYLPVQACEGFGLEITSVNPFDVLLNNRLTQLQTKEFRISTEALKKIAGETGMVAIFSNDGFDNMKCLSAVTSKGDPLEMKASNMSSFMIVAGIFLCTIFILLLRTQPALTFDYFNMAKVFSLRPSDETQSIRLTSVNNLYFYVFCSALVAVVLVAFKHGADLTELSFAQACKQTALLVALLFGLFMAKALWIRILGSLFNLTDFGPGQFQDYVKIWLISFSGCALLLIVLVMTGANWLDWINPLSYFIVALLNVFVGITFLKLMSRGGFTAFHLFSYLCSAEIVPLIILFSIYFF